VLAGTVYWLGSHRLPITARTLLVHGQSLQCHVCDALLLGSLFLTENSDAVQGRGLEIDQIATLKAYGGDRITKALAINVVPGPGIDIVADLADAGHVPADEFDVFINQFAFHVIHDDLKALYHSIRMLRPGGTLLCNFVCVAWFPEQGFPCGDSRFDMMRWYTPAGVRAMLRKLLPEDCFTITAYGNRMMHLAYVLAWGIEAFPKSLVDHRESGWPVLICVRVTKPVDWQATVPESN